MKLFKVWNTSSDWWVVAPNEEIAIDYSYKNTSTREKKNLGINAFVTQPEGLNQILEGNRMGIVICVKTGEPPSNKWIFTVSHEWIPEERN
ncbi:hypothetical protein [Cylindrospermum stagnale]|uniref:hypothetical protein n=1 Tax=Cylindrospermum stagnale TaxID=142864 RepID=UPI00059DB796|nr:hypothetical protein [Cylindrospermum stagnale]